jgi:hypothetical protein
MSKMIGRDLRTGETVHHRDGDPTNDSEENLMLFPSGGAHTSYHKNSAELMAYIELVNLGPKERVAVIQAVGTLEQWAAEAIIRKHLGVSVRAGEIAHQIASQVIDKETAPEYWESEFVRLWAKMARNAS